MKKLIFPVLCILALAACTPKPANNNSQVVSNSDTVQATPQNPAQQEPELQFDAPRYKITGQVLIQGTYCGGAAPSQEILQQYENPSPANGMDVIIRKGNFNNPTSGKPLAKVSTNPQGMFKFSVPAGEYCICIGAKESNADLPTDSDVYDVDENCLGEYMKTCDLKVRVADKDVNGLKIELQQICFVNSYSGCIQYTGGLPPSAPRGNGN